MDKGNWLVEASVLTRANEIVTATKRAWHTAAAVNCTLSKTVQGTAFAAAHNCEIGPIDKERKRHWNNSHHSTELSIQHHKQTVVIDAIAAFSTV